MRVSLIMSCVLAAGCLDPEAEVEAPELGQEESPLTLTSSCTPRYASVTGATIVATRKHWLLTYATCSVDRPKLIETTKPCTTLGTCGSAVTAAMADWLVSRLAGAPASRAKHAGVPVEVFHLDQVAVVRWDRLVNPSQVLGTDWSTLSGGIPLLNTSLMPCSLSDKCVPTADEPQCPAGPIIPPRIEDFAGWCN